ncbi:ABC transporter permease [Clostridium botulinum]|uniref:ABC transporter permease subunit n=1 Tax=Clostridium botulinum TaxID=1491 RepID=UPI001969B161|nr:ABC transporter permease subunit [Clostridium botulinum]MBN3410319.1 ABC transporter permease [Clostridium botulinum]MBY6873985.1 ABC transporter permease subunit [Clostridium botulinum]
MSKYIWQELKRVLIKKKIPIIIMLIFIPIFGLINTLNTQTYEQQLNQYNAKLKNLKTMQQQSKTTMAKEELKETISDTEKSMNDIKEDLAEINNYDRSKLDKQIYELEKQSNPKNEFQINKLKYYKKYNIEKKNLPPKGIFRLFGILYTFSIVYIIFMIILLSDIVSGEYSPNTIKNLITKPISRKKIIISKFIVSTILNCTTIFISMIVFILETGILLGFSDYKFPFSISQKYVFDNSLALTPLTSQMKYVPGSQKLIPYSIALIIYVLFILIFLTAITSIIIFISTICKNSLISIFSNIILIIGLTAWYHFNIHGNIFMSAKHVVICNLFPSIYMYNIFDILHGGISRTFNCNISIFFILIVCLIWIISMIFFSTYIFRKRNFD